MKKIFFVYIGFIFYCFGSACQPIDTNCLDYDVTCNLDSALIAFIIPSNATTASSPISCPVNYVRVPFNQAVGTTKDFCVATYEMRDVGGVAVSQPNGTPWVSIDQNNARSKCSALGTDYHLITNEERMTIARNLEANATNWTGASVGSGKVYIGHGDSSPNAACDSTLEKVMTNCSTVGVGPDEKRTLALSNNETIWDFSGNVNEWVDWLIVTGRVSNCLSGGPHELNACNPTANMPSSSYQSLNLSYNSAHGIGQYYGAADGIKGASVFGGAYNSTATLPGIFALLHAPDPTDTYADVGFRCTYSP